MSYKQFEGTGASFGTQWYIRKLQIKITMIQMQCYKNTMI